MGALQFIQWNVSRARFSYGRSFLRLSVIQSFSHPWQQRLKSLQVDIKKFENKVKIAFETKMSHGLMKANSISPTLAPSLTTTYIPIHLGSQSTRKSCKATLDYNHGT